jgi:hypothetical protein
MAWEDELAAARIEIKRSDDARHAKARANRAAEEARDGRFNEPVAELLRIRAALEQAHWPRAATSREGMFRIQRVVEMPVMEIVTREGDHETGLVDLTARILYYKYPAHDGPVICVQAGTLDSWTRERAGAVEFLGSRWREVTPELMIRAAARYCVTRSVALSL